MRASTNSGIIKDLSAARVVAPPASATAERQEVRPVNPIHPGAHEHGIRAHKNLRQIPSRRESNRDGVGAEVAEVANELPCSKAPVDIDLPVDVKEAARFLGVSASLVYSYVERRQIPHFRMMGRAIRFRLSELEAWRQQFHVDGETNG
jgi:excisionase family DNA binding protein